MFFRTNRGSLKYAVKESSKVNACGGIHLNAIKTQIIPDNSDQLLTPTRSDTYCFSAASCSLDLQATVSCHYFKLDKDLNHAGLRTGLYGHDLIHESLFNLLHFSSQQRNKFLYFCGTIVNIVFSFINISTLHTLSDNFQQIVPKFAIFYLFYPFFYCFLCIKFLFKNFIVCIIFSNQYPN